MFAKGKPICENAPHRSEKALKIPHTFMKKALNEVV